MPILYTARQNVYATDGGRGALAVGDTSVYGIRQPKQAYPGTTTLVVPGTGGGVRAMRKFNYGSRAQGFNPNGLVVVRITKVGE